MFFLSLTQGLVLSSSRSDGQMSRTLHLILTEMVFRTPETQSLSPPVYHLLSGYEGDVVNVSATFADVK